MYLNIYVPNVDDKGLCSAPKNHAHFKQIFNAMYVVVELVH